MFCPRCAQEMVSDELRYCSGCGFDLTGVKACLADEGAAGANVIAGRSLARTRRADVNAGVIVMLLGSLLTSALVAIGDTGFIRFLDFGLAGAFLVLTLSFVSILLFSEPLTRAINKIISPEESPGGSAVSRRRESCFGATLMYVGTILSACSMAMVRGPLETPMFFIMLMTVFVLLLLTSQRLLGGVRELLTERATDPTDMRHAAHTLTAQAAHALPPAQQGVPVSAFDSRQRVQTAEMRQPLSVTERTTNLLDKN